MARDSVAGELPTIRDVLEDQGISIADAIRNSGLEKPNSVRTWLGRNVWPLEDLLKFAAKNDMGSDLESLAEFYSFELVGQDQVKLEAVRNRRLYAPIEQLFKEVAAGYVMDHRGRPPSRHESLDDVILYVQSSAGYIAARDADLADKILDLVSHKIRVCYLFGADDQEEASFGKDPLVRSLAGTFRHQSAKRDDSAVALSRIYCIRVRPAWSLSDLLTRVVLVTAVPKSSGFPERVWTRATVVLQLHVGLDDGLETHRFRQTTWRTIRDVKNFANTFYNEYLGRIFPGDPGPNGAVSTVIPLSEIE